MKKLLKTISVLLLSFASLVFFVGVEIFIGVDVAYAAAVSWDGGGDVDDWCTDANWSNDAEPTSADDVTIDTAVTVTTSGCVTEVHTLNFSTLVVGGTAAATLEIQANIGTGGSITIGNLGTVTQKNTTQQIITGTLTIQSGGTLNHTDNSTAQSNVINISAATITVNSGGSINVDGKGNTGGAGTANGNGTGPGLGVSNNDASGGGHGGDGGNSGTPLAGGTAYCDVTGPATIGSGGGGGGYSGSNNGGDGGGLIVLNATGTITISGTITADGAAGGVIYGYDGGGGAGGGVKITADTIAGTPSSFTVTGGNAGGTGGGPGGGGCVYLGYTTSNSVLSTAITMNGGTTGSQKGGAGIVYMKQTGTSGDLYLTNGGTAGAASTQNLSSLTVATITLKSEAEYKVGSGKTFILNSVGNDPLSGGDGTGVLRIDDSAVFTPNATFSITGATLELHQSATFNNATTLTIGSNGIFDMRDFTTSLALSKTTVTVNSGGTITSGDNTTEASNAPSHTVNISATTVTVNSGGSIDVDGKGNTTGVLRTNGNGTAPGLGSAANDASGAGHGGNGGNSGDPLTGGTAYCNVTNPATIGSGGGSGGSGGSLGGDGGGLVILNVTGTITVGGTITVDGANGATQNTDDGGGGAGGGLKIVANAVVFSGSITATGGNAGGTGGGAGGGGCVYIGYTASYDSTGSSNTVVAGTTGGAGGVGTFTTAQLNQAPTVVVNSAAQKTFGTGTVDLSATFDDADDNNTLKAKVEYKAGADCSSGTSDPTLDETDANTTSTYGDPKLENDDEYHVGNASGWITTSSGANTVLFDWLAETDLPTANGTYCVKVTPHDGTTAGTAQTTTLTLDNVNPTSAGNLTLNAIAADSLTFTLGVAGSDTNINQYKVYYKAGASGVSETDTLHTTIATGAYVGGGTTQISTLSVNTQYVANIWTYDSYGNKANATEIAKYTAANVPSAPTVTTASTTSLTVVINQNSNPSNTTYAIKVGSQYVQADGTLGASEVWQTYTTWGGATGQSVTGLSVNIQYVVSVKARNGDNTETSLSSESSKYTLSNPVTGLAASMNTSSGAVVSWNANGNPSGTVYNVTGISGSSATSGNIINNSWTDGSARNVDTNYCYSVVSVNGDGVSSTSLGLSGTNCAYQGGGGGFVYTSSKSSVSSTGGSTSTTTDSVSEIEEDDEENISGEITSSDIPEVTESELDQKNKLLEAASSTTDLITGQESRELPQEPKLQIPQRIVVSEVSVVEIRDTGVPPVVEANMRKIVEAKETYLVSVASSSTNLLSDVGGDILQPGNKDLNREKLLMAIRLQRIYPESWPMYRRKSNDALAVLDSRKLPYLDENKVEIVRNVLESESIVDLDSVQVNKAEEIVAKVVDDSLQKLFETISGSVELPVYGGGGGAIVLVNKKTKIKFSFSLDESNKLKKQAKEKKENLLVVDTSSDLDGNGVADLFQIMNGQPLFVKDPDEDGFETTDEIFFGGNPLKTDDFEDLIPSKPKITNLPKLEELEMKSIEVGPDPVFWVAGPIGEEVVLNFVSLDDEDIIFRSEPEIINLDFKAVIEMEGLPQGEYYLVLTEEKGVSSVAKVTVNPDFDEQSKLSLNKDNFLTGETKNGVVVHITWQSLVLNSVVIADASQGKFEANTPDNLEKGEHNVVTYYVNPKKKFLSSAKKRKFFVK